MLQRFGRGLPLCYGLRVLNRSTRAAPYQTVVAHPYYRTVFDVVSLLNRFYVWKAIKPLYVVCKLRTATKPLYVVWQLCKR